MDVSASLAAPGIASDLYARSVKVLEAAPRPEFAAAEAGAGRRFADIAASLIGAIRTGETTAEAGLIGRADPHSVVTALASSEIAVQTAVTVRDKVVEAYQEILRMPV